MAGVGRALLFTVPLAGVVAVAFTFVPTQPHTGWHPLPSPAEIRRIEAITPSNEQARAYRDAYLLWARGHREPEGPAWPPTYRWIWDRVEPRESFDGSGVRATLSRLFVLNWPILLAEQALILLFGGALLTWAARRRRRKETAET